MSISQYVQWGAFQVRHSFQEIYEIGTNAQLLYKYGDFPITKIKTITLDEIVKLCIHPTIHRSEHFLFQNYSFTELTDSSDPHNYKVTITPDDNQTPSLYSTFVQESLIRIVHAVAVVAFTALSSPIWFPFLIGATYYQPKEITESLHKGWMNGICAPTFIEIPKEPERSHVNANDILRIGNKLLGYRHTQDVKETQKGIQSGCALNISFCPSESRYDKATFEKLNRKIERGEDCTELIKQYEQAITTFIKKSIVGDRPPPKTYGEALNVLYNTYFLIIKPGSAERASDPDQYDGLGRFSKTTILPENIIAPEFVHREELNIPVEKDSKRFSSLYEDNQFLNYIASFYRLKLLTFIREEDLSTFSTDIYNTE